MNYELKLRAVEPEDAELMYCAEDDPAAWTYSDYFAPMSLELLREYALSYDADPLRSGQLRLIVEADGRPAGILDLFDISARHLRADTGIYLFPEYRDKGIGTLVLEAAKDFCRCRLGLHQLTASVAKSNPEALGCYRKAGFTSTGQRRDWLRMAEGWVDVELLWCML